MKARIYLWTPDRNHKMFDVEFTVNDALSKDGRYKVISAKACRTGAVMDAPTVMLWNGQGYIDSCISNALDQKHAALEAKVTGKSKKITKKIRTEDLELPPLL